MTVMLSHEGEFNERWYDRVCFVFGIALLGFWNNMPGLFFFFMQEPRDCCQPAWIYESAGRGGNRWLERFRP